MYTKAITILIALVVAFPVSANEIMTRYFTAPNVGGTFEYWIGTFPCYENLPITKVEMWSSQATPSQTVTLEINGEIATITHDDLGSGTWIPFTFSSSVPCTSSYVNYKLSAPQGVNFLKSNLVSSIKPTGDRTVYMVNDEISDNDTTYYNYARIFGFRAYYEEPPGGTTLEFPDQINTTSDTDELTIFLLLLLIFSIPAASTMIILNRFHDRK